MNFYSRTAMLETFFIFFVYPECNQWFYGFL